MRHRIPFGWRKGDDGRLVPVVEQQAALRDMAERIAAGESLRDVARRYGMEHTSVRHMLRSDRVLAALPPDLASELRAELRRKEQAFRPGTRSLLGGIAR